MKGAIQETYLFVGSRTRSRTRDKPWIQVTVVNFRSVFSVRFIPRLCSVRRILFCSRKYNRVTRLIYRWYVHSRWNCNISEVTWGSVCSRPRSFKPVRPLRFSFCISKTVWFYRIKLTYIMNRLTRITNLFVIAGSRLRIKLASSRFEFSIFTKFGRFSSNHLTRRIITIWS